MGMGSHRESRAVEDCSLGFNTIVHAKTGTFLVNRNDKYVGRSLIEYGEFSEQEGDFLVNLIDPGDTVVEVGANIGGHTVRMAKKAGWVIAFEPQRIVHQLLCANIALNSLRNVDAHWAAVGEKMGKIQVFEINPDIPDNFGGLALNLGYEGPEVPCYTLDSFVNVPSLKLLKVDVEGMELDVLKGAVKTIEKHQPFLYVENDRPENSKALLEFIADFGYSMFWHAPPLFQRNNFNGKEEDIFGNIHSYNLMCVPKRFQEHFTMPAIDDFTYHPFLCQLAAA